MLRGDILVVLRQAAHALFTRSGDNLVMKLEIPLVEALTGLQLEIKRLDDSMLRRKVNAVVKPGEVLRLENEGMPIKNSRRRGDLLVEFAIKFPEAITETQKKRLREVLDNRPEEPSKQPQSSPSKPQPAQSFGAPVFNFLSKTKSFLASQFLRSKL